MLIVLGRLHIMSISKSTYSNCAALHVLTNCKKFSEMYTHNAGIAHIQLVYLGIIEREATLYVSGLKFTIVSMHETK